MLGDNGGASTAEGSGGIRGIWIYGGIGIAIIVVGVVIFHFATQKEAPPAADLKAAPSAAVPPKVQFGAFPAFGAPDISVGVQTAGSSGEHVVVRWDNLPSGTREINVFKTTGPDSSSTFLGTLKVPTSSLFHGSSTLSINIPSSPQNGNFFGTPSGGPPPSNAGQNSNSTSSNTTNQNSNNSNNTNNSTSTNTTSTNTTPPSQGGNPTSTPSNSSTTNNVVTAVCSPNSITLLETSQCVLDVNGVVQNNVAWTMAFGSAGSVSAGGLYTPSATGTEAITGTLSDGTWSDAVVTVSSSAQSQNSSSSQPTTCPAGYVLNGNTCIQNGSMPIQSSLAWNGSFYNVENGLYTTKDVVYISNVTNIIQSATVFCSYSQYSVDLQYLGNGNYEITGLSSHGCNNPNSINYLDFGGFAGNGLEISIVAP